MNARDESTIVSDIGAGVDFYRSRLGFAVDMQAEGFAALSRGDPKSFLPGAAIQNRSGS